MHETRKGGGNGTRSESEPQIQRTVLSKDLIGPGVGEGERGRTQ